MKPLNYTDTNMNIPSLTELDLRILITYIKPMVKTEKKIFESTSSLEAKQTQSTLSNILDKLQNALLSN